MVMTVTMRKLHSCKYIFVHLFIILVAASAKTQGNPANDLVDIINKNRTAHKLPKLFNNPGLGCMALQYISECKGNCSSNSRVRCELPEDDITEIFAPNCGVELPTVGIVSGRIVGCWWNYLEPAQAFSSALILDQKTLSILHQKEHREVGVGLGGTHKGPFFWCALFSSGPSNSSFVLEGGRGITQKRGCFSGTDITCSAGQRLVFFKAFSAVILSVVCLVFIFLF